MKTTFKIDCITEVRVSQEDDRVDITLVNPVSDDTYILEVPIGEVLDYLADNLMFHSLAGRIEEMLQAPDF